MVQGGAYGGVEEHVPANRNEQKVGVLAGEGRSVGNNSKPLKEVSIGQTAGTSAVEDKIRIISNRIKHSDFGKIVDRGRGGMDSARDYREGEFGGQIGGMIDDGQCILGKNDPTCGANDQWNNPDKGNTRHIGAHQELHNSTSREVGVEDGSNGGMEMEGH